MAAFLVTGLIDFLGLAGTFFAALTEVFRAGGFLRALREGLGAGFAGFLEAGFLAGAFFLVGFLAMSLGGGCERCGEGIFFLWVGLVTPPYDIPQD